MGLFRSKAYSLKQEVLADFATRLASSEAAVSRAFTQDELGGTRLNVWFASLVRDLQRAGYEVIDMRQPDWGYTAMVSVRKGREMGPIGRAGGNALSLSDSTAVSLMHMAVDDSNYGAVQDLHATWSRVIPNDRLWSWWMDQCQRLLSQGDRETAILAATFATEVSSVDPWPDMPQPLYHQFFEIRRGT